jgi:restriction endonuclease S subunit
MSTSKCIRINKKSSANVSEPKYNYECRICSKKSEQKGHHELHLMSEGHSIKRELLQLKLQTKTRIELLKGYNTDNIDKILVRLENSYFIGYEFQKQRRSQLPPVYELTSEEIQEQAQEIDFKDKFTNFLGKQHNLLRGAAVTGDDAFDDILYILMYCFLQGKDFTEGKYDFHNKEHYEEYDILEEEIDEYLEYLSLDTLINDTLGIRPKSGICAITKIGTILKNHPTTSGLITQENFLNCDNRGIIIKCLNETNKFLQDNDITQYQDIVGIAYEYFSNKHSGNGGTSKEMGQYFTERPLMGMTFQLIEPDDLVSLEIDEKATIGDEFCATFGYPLYLRKYLKDTFNLNIKDENMYGIEYHDRLSRMALLNAMFSMESYPEVKKGDSFRTNLTEHLDISVHNVPFGQSMKCVMIKETYNTNKEENPSEQIPEFKEVVPIEVNVDAILASQVALFKTKKMGLLIIKDGKETSSESHKDYRKLFCEKTCIKKILKIPSGAFSSTGTKTICIYFVKKEGLKTEEVQFLELNQEGTKMSEICKVSIMDLKTKNYSWDPEVYIIDETFESMKAQANCEFVKLGDVCEFFPKSKRTAKYGKSTGTYPFFKSSMVVNSFVNEPDFNEESLIMGDGGSANINYGCNFSTSDHCYVFRSSQENLFNKYIYYYLLFNMDIIEKYYKGSGLCNISKSNIKELELPLPSPDIQTKTLEILNDLDSQKQNLEQQRDGLERRMKYYLEKEIKKNNTKFEDIQKIYKVKNGKYNSNDMDNKGEYNFYGCKAVNPVGTHSIFNNDYPEYLLLIGAGGSQNNLCGLNVGLGKCYYVNGKTATRSCVYSLIPLNNNNIIKFHYHYLNIFREFTNKKAKFTTNLGTISKLSIEEIKIPIIDIEKQQEIVAYLDTLEIKKNSIQEELDQIDILMKDVLEQSYQ